MTDAYFDWSAFEEELFTELHRALVRLAASAKGREFYAVALYGVYRELDRMLTLPLLAAADVAGGAPPDEAGFWGERWNPSDWDFTEVRSVADGGVGTTNGLGVGRLSPVRGAPRTHLTPAQRPHAVPPHGV